MLQKVKIYKPWADLLYLSDYRSRYSFVGVKFFLLLLSHSFDLQAMLRSHLHPSSSDQRMSPVSESNLTYRQVQGHGCRVSLGSLDLLQMYQPD